MRYIILFLLFPFFASAQLLEAGGKVVTGTTGQTVVHNGTGFVATTTVLKASATLDFPATTGPLPETLTVTVTGAALGDVAQVAPVSGWSGTSWLLSAYVSGVNQVTIQATNLSGVNTDLASQVYNVIVTKY